MPSTIRGWALIINIILVALHLDKRVGGAAAAAGLNSRTATATAAPVRLLETAIKFPGREYHGQTYDECNDDILPHSCHLSEAHERP